MKDQLYKTGTSWRRFLNFKKKIINKPLKKEVSLFNNKEISPFAWYDIIIISREFSELSEDYRERIAWIVLLNVLRRVIAEEEKSFMNIIWYVNYDMVKKIKSWLIIFGWIWWTDEMAIRLLSGSFPGISWLPIVDFGDSYWRIIEFYIDFSTLFHGIQQPIPKLRKLNFCTTESMLEVSTKNRLTRYKQATNFHK